MAKKVSLCGILIALALALSFAERWFPLQLLIPLPGVKLGLANIVTLVALYRLNTRYAFCVLIPRCVLGAVFSGGITGLLFSLTGGILALLVMAVAKKSELFSIYGVSVLGAAAHSIGQILAAMALMGSVYIGAYLTWLLLVSLFTGLAIGMLCHAVLRGLKLGGTL